MHEFQIPFSPAKGGIQLWQFCYALLTDPENMHPELIEWTCNRRENEFPFLEPEAIAVWWGYNKNKVNMSYEKIQSLSQHDNGILRKIPGKHYIYIYILLTQGRCTSILGNQIASLISNQCLKM